MKNHYFKFLALFLSFGSTALFAQTQIWQWAFHAGDHGNESATSVAVDASGNAYITGPYTSAFINFGTFSLLNSFSGTADIFLVKFDPSGTVLWAKTFGGADGDQGNSVAVDASGNVILTGWFASASLAFDSIVLTNSGTTSSDLFISKFDSSGNLIWAKSAGGTINDRGYGVSTDANSNIFVTGWYSSPTINFGTGVLTNAGSATNDIFLVKYDANGTALWSKKIGGNNNDAGNACATDASGNTYVTGNFASSSINFGTGALTNAGSGTNDLFITKYDPLGASLWSARAGGIYNEMGNGLAISGSNVYLTGDFSSPTVTFGSNVLTNASAGTNDIFLASYSSTGTVNWSERAGGIDADEGKCVCADASGNAFISGSFISTSISFGIGTLTNYSAGTKDLFIASYSNTGNAIWSLEVGNYADEIGNGIASSSNSNTIYLGGMFNSGSVNFGTNTIYKGCGDDVFYAKLDMTTGMQDASFLIDFPFTLFPNPSSNGIFSINDELVNAEVEIYNIMGEEIYSNSHVQNTIDLSDQAKGVYLVRFNLKEKILSQKIIIE